MRRFNLIFLFILLNICLVQAQGINRNFLLGYTIGTDQYAPHRRGQLSFDSTSIAVNPDSFKLAFRASQATISDSNGNMIISTNGCWIADATGDTMQNGSGLNPNSYTSVWCGNNSGIPLSASTLILPWPADVSKYILFHQTGNYTTPSGLPTDLFTSTIDILLNTGLGSVYNKNNSIIQDELNFGLTACRHANGRDWWIITLKAHSNIVYKLLLTPVGIQSITQQTLGYSSHGVYGGTPIFSNDGSKFSYYYYFGQWNNITNSIRVMDFDRCSGMFSNFDSVVQIDSMPGFGLSFSPDSRLLYWSTFNKIFQINTDSNNLASSQQLVAVNDGYCFPFSFLCTDFWMMYLAANGKIYISSGNSVLDLHYIDFPDSIGSACSVQQHALHLPCYSGRGHVNHPNYYLGPIAGSVCDSLGVGIAELDQVRNFKLHPNPMKSGGSIEISYLLPQNKSGLLDITDALGRKIYSHALPPWSTTQQIQLPTLTPGLYLFTILSAQSRMSLKVVIY